jgi:hypothetical protein
LTSAKHAYKQSAIRHLGNKKEIDKYKVRLPAITVSGEFAYREASALVQHSGLICLDIDLKGNESVRNYIDLKHEFSKIKNVAYCGFSVSGTGLFLIIPIAYPEQHESQFNALQQLFESQFGVKVDAKCKDVCRLRGYAYDEEGYFNHQAISFTGLYTSIQSSPRGPSIPKITPDGHTAQRVEELIQLIEQLKIDVTDDYNDWLKIGFALAKEFGESGRSFMHRISQFSPKYYKETTNRKFDDWLKTENIRTNIATLFYICTAHGVKLFEKELPHSIAKESDCQPSKKITFDEDKIEQLDIKFCDSYPPEWDEPNPADMVPIIKFLNSFEVRQKYPTLNK